MKKKCGYTHADVRLYIQNRMSREEETEFQQHLQNCENCREELIVLRRITRSIGKKERRTVSFRTWMIAASLACLIIGEGFYCYYLIKGENTRSSPGDSQEFKINPPALHLHKDSITPQDSLPADTLQMEITD